MAETQKIDDISMITVSSRVLAEIIGVGERQVRNLAEEGIHERNSHGKYLFLKSVKNYIINLKIAKAGERVASDFDGAELDWEQEKARHEHLKSMITEINLQLIKGQVHRSQDVGSVISDMFTKFRSKMMALPSKLAPKLQKKAKEEIADILRVEVAEALNELADYNPADYYSEEHVEIEQDALFDPNDTERFCIDGSEE